MAHNAERELNTMIRKIISGGQTGVDQAALDVAIELGIPHSGWIPKGRLTEDGRLPDKYQLQEMPTDKYPPRTERNVVDSDGTLIISHGKLTGGSKLTQKMALKHERPFLYVNLNEIDISGASRLIYDWLQKEEIKILNVAGSRASRDPKIYRDTMSLLKEFFTLNR